MDAGHAQPHNVLLQPVSQGDETMADNETPMVESPQNDAADRPPVRGLEDASAIAHHIQTRLQTAVMGRDEMIELILVALLADGHVLLEDYPNSGKTTL